MIPSINPEDVNLNQLVFQVGPLWALAKKVGTVSTKTLGQLVEEKARTLTDDKMLLKCLSEELPAIKKSFAKVQTQILGMEKPDEAMKRIADVLAEAAIKILDEKPSKENWVKVNIQEKGIKHKYIVWKDKDGKWKLAVREKLGEGTFSRVERLKMLNDTVTYILKSAKFESGAVDEKRQRNVKAAYKNLKEMSRRVKKKGFSQIGLQELGPDHQWVTIAKGKWGEQTTIGSLEKEYDVDGVNYFIFPIRELRKLFGLALAEKLRVQYSEKLKKNKSLNPIDFLKNLAAAGFIDFSESEKQHIMKAFPQITNFQKSLEEVKENRKNIRPAQWLDILQQMFHGAAVLTRLGFVHMDIKSDNLFLKIPKNKNDYYEVVIGDFGGVILREKVLKGIIPCPTSATMLNQDYQTLKSTTSSSTDKEALLEKIKVFQLARSFCSMVIGNSLSADEIDVDVLKEELQNREIPDEVISLLLECLGDSAPTSEQAWNRLCEIIADKSTDFPGLNKRWAEQYKTTTNSMYTEFKKRSNYSGVEDSYSPKG